MYSPFGRGAASWPGRRRMEARHEDGYERRRGKFRRKGIERKKTGGERRNQ